MGVNAAGDRAVPRPGHAGFGSESFTMARTGLIGPIIDNYDVRLRTHTLNFGLAYRFN